MTQCDPKPWQQSLMSLCREGLQLLELGAMRSPDPEWNPINKHVSNTCWKCLQGTKLGTVRNFGLKGCPASAVVMEGVLSPATA